MANNPSFLRSGGLSFTEGNPERRRVVPVIKEFKRGCKTELNVFYHLGEYINIIGGLTRIFLSLSAKGSPVTFLTPVSLRPLGLSYTKSCSLSIS